MVQTYPNRSNMVQNQSKKCPNGSGITRSPGLVLKLPCCKPALKVRGPRYSTLPARHFRGVRTRRHAKDNMDVTLACEEQQHQESTSSSRKTSVTRQMSTWLKIVLGQATSEVSKNKQKISKEGYQRVPVLKQVTKNSD